MFVNEQEGKIDGNQQQLEESQANQQVVQLNESLMDPQQPQTWTREQLLQQQAIMYSSHPTPYAPYLPMNIPPPPPPIVKKPYPVQGQNNDWESVVRDKIKQDKARLKEEKRKLKLKGSNSDYRVELDKAVIYMGKGRKITAMQEELEFEKYKIKMAEGQRKEEKRQQKREIAAKKVIEKKEKKAKKQIEKQEKIVRKEKEKIEKKALKKIEKAEKKVRKKEEKKENKIKKKVKKKEMKILKKELKIKQKEGIKRDKIMMKQIKKEDKIRKERKEETKIVLKQEKKLVTIVAEQKMKEIKLQQKKLKDEIKEAEKVKKIKEKEEKKKFETLMAERKLEALRDKLNIKKSDVTQAVQIMEEHANVELKENKVTVKCPSEYSWMDKNEAKIWKVTTIEHSDSEQVSRRYDSCNNR
ncbi:uncharacterized protein LOC144743148 [Ciona intestinalis]